MNRNSDLLQNLRPSIKTQEITDNLIPEWFQNNVLRSIIKFQHSLLIHYISQQKLLFKSLAQSDTEEQARELISIFIQKQSAVKNQLIGFITGLLTNEEFSSYLENQSEFNRRIIQMISQRLFDSREEWMTF